MSTIKLNQSDIGSSANAKEMTNSKTKKAIKYRTRDKTSPEQHTDLRKDIDHPPVGSGIIDEEQTNTSLIKKSKKPSVRASADKIDTSSANNDNEETQNISLKRKRGRPPKCKNEIVKSHWLGFFAFVAENGYFEVSK